MDTPELYRSSAANPTASSTGAVAGLERNLTSLRSLLVATLVILIVGGLGVNVLLVRQVGAARRVVEDLEKRVEPASAQFETTFKPRISMFLQALVAFAQTNRDFLPILQKYPISAAPGPQAAAPVAPAVVAPAPAPAKK
ncbi:MAG TPA: hypothetical protein VI454_13335 [Verrucomicrobiae bacterium]|jgi:hypothetical protein